MRETCIEVGGGRLSDTEAVNHAEDARVALRRLIVVIQLGAVPRGMRNGESSSNDSVATF